MSLGTLAIVGAPSVGKSTIFNRIVGSRKAIVEPTRGITRDRLYAKANWLTKDFTVIDTGGIQIKDAPFQEEIRVQVEIALKEADIILFVVDGKLGLSGDDRFIAKLLYQSGKKIILAVNKIDNIEEVANQSEFYKLGFGTPFVVSGAHGIGIGDLLDEIIKDLPEKVIPIYKDAISFCLIGRPNVGKSSLANRLIGDSRSIVSSVAGTTRDSLDTPFTNGGHNYVVIDTAGLVKRGKIYEAVDKYSALRALEAIDRSQVAVLLIDAKEGLIEQDKHVVGYAMDAKKAIILVVNKWDLEKHTEADTNELIKKLRLDFKFLDYAPILFMSAKTGKGVEKLLPSIQKAYEGFNRRIPTPILNRIISDAQAVNPTPSFNHGRLKIVFANQVAICPPTFVFFCNNPNYVHFSYTRYLENRLRESFDFTGTPLNIIYRMRK
jgi:GTP-binding protein